MVEKVSLVDVRDVFYIYSRYAKNISALLKRYFKIELLFGGNIKLCASRNMKIIL